MGDSHAALIAALKHTGCQPTQTRDGWRARCPAHDDKAPSLSVGHGTAQEVVVHCHAGCTFEAIMAALHLDRPPRVINGRRSTRPALGDPIAVYDYGTYEVCRFAPKTFRQRRPDGQGGYMWSLKGIAPRLYHQDSLRGHIMIAEGEKDVDRVRKDLGYMATCNSGGAGEWKPWHTQALIDASVTHAVVLPDNDDPGRKHAQAVAAACFTGGIAVKVVEVPAPHKDVSAYLDAGGDPKALAETCRAAAQWEPSGVAEREPAAARPMFKRKDAAALEAALDTLGLEVRYNIRTARNEYREQSSVWTPFNERAAAEIRARIALTFNYQRVDRGPAPLDFGREAWTDKLNALLFRREVDPFVEYLEALPAWDTTDRIDHYLDDLFGVERGPLVLWIAQYLTVGAVQRAYRPGCRLDEMPVLIGAQDTGKSTLLRALLPPDHQAEWFSDGLHLAADPKVRAEALQGRVIVEVAEMAGSTRADLESLKAFLSRQDDGATRLSYRRDPESTPRRCILAGTANPAHCLPNDPTGLRRFIPLELGPEQTAVEPYLETNRTQLWAEALHRHRAGAEARLPRELKGAAATAAENHRNRDVLIEDAIENLQPGVAGTLAEIAAKVGLVSAANTAIVLSMRDSKRLAAALGAKHYRMSRRTVAGKRVSWWESATLRF